NPFLQRDVRGFPAFDLLQVSHDGDFFSPPPRTNDLDRACVRGKNRPSGSNHGPRDCQPRSDPVGTRLLHPTVDKNFPADRDHDRISWSGWQGKIDLATPVGEARKVNDQRISFLQDQERVPTREWYGGGGSKFLGPVIFPKLSREKENPRGCHIGNSPGQGNHVEQGVSPAG